MASNSTTAVIRGKTSYAKVLGTPRLNYSKDGHEWTVDVILDDDTVKTLKRLGISDRIRSKDNYLDGQDFISFKHRLEKKPSAKNPDGGENKPIKIVDAKGAVWDQSVMIGNGSVVDVKFDVVDYGKGMKKGCYIRAIRVLDLVPYAPKEFDDLSEDDQYYSDTSPEADEPPFDTDEVVM